ncbi:hypothetical protein K4L06_11995 [Lysobacter sp. BMK333-48F3]|uniref:hypothetical protein n=1 Tax=Lysobacter sp. BMK333-48F3 TaxID=2867962 RepID=UPI001C8CD5F3|nr:hypothetical protein [Lysobacter sp. BMK333-48F3]MBX9402028.1 hypothetical protein [Lysobacter sp. BMK333-48F3]
MNPAASWGCLARLDCTASPMAFGRSESAASALADAGARPAAGLDLALADVGMRARFQGLRETSGRLENAPFFVAARFQQRGIDYRPESVIENPLSGLFVGHRSGMIDNHF